MYKRAASYRQHAGNRDHQHPGVTQAEAIALQLMPDPAKVNDAEIERLQNARARISLRKFSWEG